jgi:hypothetical protein
MSREARSSPVRGYLGQLEKGRRGITVGSYRCRIAPYTFIISCPTDRRNQNGFNSGKHTYLMASIKSIKRSSVNIHHSDIESNGRDRP